MIFTVTAQVAYLSHQEDGGGGGGVGVSRGVSEAPGRGGVWVRGCGRDQEGEVCG